MTRQQLCGNIDTVTTMNEGLSCVIECDIIEIYQQEDFIMEIRHLGTEFPLNIKVIIWGKKLKYVAVRVSDEKADDEKYENDEFIRHIRTAVNLAESSRDDFIRKAVEETDMPDIKLKAVGALFINSGDADTYYDYYIDVGKQLGGFKLHFTGTPDGTLKCCGLTM